MERLVKASDVARHTGECTRSVYRKEKKMTKKTERGAEATSHLNSSRKKGITQEESALRYMRRHGSLTTLSAVSELYIMNPQQVISKLRRQGYRIDTVYEKTPLGKRYGRYILKEETA